MIEHRDMNHVKLAELIEAAPRMGWREMREALDQRRRHVNRIKNHLVGWGYTDKSGELKYVNAVNKARVYEYLYKKNNYLQPTEYSYFGW